MCSWYSRSGVSGTGWELAGGLQQGDDFGRQTAAQGLTEALRSSGQFPEALQLGRETLITVQRHVQRVYGDDDDTTVHAANPLASVHLDMGDFSTAMPLRTKALTVAQRVYGSKHAETLIIKGSLAALHSQMGSPELALFIYIEVLETLRGVLGSENRSTLATMGNIATLYSDMGSDELALPLHRETLETRRRVLSSQHPGTLYSIFSHGTTLGVAGDHAAAIPLLEGALAGLTVMHGPEHPTMRMCQSELEGIEQCLANPPAAAQLLRQQRLDRQQIN